VKVGMAINTVQLQKMSNIVSLGKQRNYQIDKRFFARVLSA
jgi:hypothetical protein